MITDFQCNMVYLSSSLRRESPKTYASLVSALEKHGAEYRFLDNTHDIWCRDYMPVQVAIETRSVKGEREKNRVIDWLIEMYVF